MVIPYIDEYALLCARHPSLEGGYRQWLRVVAFTYDISETDKGKLVWSIDYYKRLAGLE